MKRAVSVIVAVVALAAAFAVGWAVDSGGTSANAAVSEPATLVSAVTGTSAPTAADAAQRYENFVGAVAAKVGVSSGALDSAIRSVAISRVQAAAKAGTIKSATATKIEQAIANHDVAALMAQRREALATRTPAHSGARRVSRLRRWLR
jgi:hypothetical protein